MVAIWRMKNDKIFKDINSDFKREVHYLQGAFHKFNKIVKDGDLMD